MTKPIRLLEQRLHFSRSTKSFHRYDANADDADAHVRSLYVAKIAFHGEPPKIISITVEAPA